MTEQTNQLRAEMLEAFFAIEPHDAHVKTRREVKAGEQGAAVAASVAHHRAMTGATGVPETMPTKALEPIVHRMAPDPSMTASQYYHERTSNPAKPNIGKVQVATNMVTLIGGLALIRRRLSHHEKAAAWFKSAYEALYGGMSPAIDMSRVRVDTSIMAHDNGAVARLDQAKALLALFGTQKEPPLMPKAALDRIIACVVLGIPCADNAPVGKSGKPSGRAVEREVDRLLDALDTLAEIRGYRTKGKAA